MRRVVLIGVVLALLGGLAWVVLRPSGDPKTTENTVAEAQPLAEFEQVDVRAPDEGLTLTGIVKDGAGKPVPNAEVFLSSSAQTTVHSLKCPVCNEPLLSCRARETAESVQALLAANRGELSPAAQTKSDADGKFRFEHLRGVSFTLWSHADGFGDGVKERAAPGDPVEIFLPPLRAVMGRLVDEDGKPVVNGTVRAISRRVARFFSATSDQNGLFEVRGLGEGPFYLIASAPGMVPAALNQVDAGPDIVKLTLNRSRKLEVTLSSQGKPIEGTVRLTGDHLTREANTKSAATSFAGLYPDRVLVTAVSGPLCSVPQSLTLTANVTRVNLELGPGGLVQVTAVDENEQPVPNPELTLLTLSGEVVMQKKVRTGEAAALGPVGQGDYNVRAVATGFSTSNTPVKVGDTDQSLQVTLQKGTLISGRVLDEYGRPAPGVSVLISPTGETVVANQEGHFDAAVPSPGLYELHAHHSDWGGGQIKVTAPANNVDLQLEPRSGAAVTVIAGGRRVEGANVVLYIEKEGSFRNDRPSGADGVVLMRGLPAGAYFMVASHPDYLPSERVPVTLTDGTLLQLEAQLKLGAKVTGTVVDELDAPVAGVTINVLPRGAEPSTSDAQGKFELSPLRPEQTYMLHVTQRGVDQVDRVLAQAGGPPVKVVVRRQPVFTGRVVTEDGKPVARFRIEDHDVEAGDGRFELPLPATKERVIFSVESTGYEPLLVDRPPTPDLGDLTLKKAPSLSGTVNDSQGNPVADAIVGCDTCEQSVRTATDGTFTLASPAFVHEFVVTAHKGKRSGSKTVQTGARAIDITLQPAATLTGAVYRNDGRPASGVEVEGVQTERSETVSAVTGPDGRYSLDVSPGGWRFVVSASTFGGGGQGLDPLAVITEIDGSSELNFGPAPGTSSVVAHVNPQRGYALWLVKGALDNVGNPPLELLHASYAQLVYQPASERVSFSGLEAGTYTLVWASFHAESSGGPVVQVVGVPSSSEVSLVR